MYSSLLISVYIVCIATATFAQPKGYKYMSDSISFCKNFQQKSTAIKTNEADFKQEKSMAMVKNKIYSNGKFFYKASNQMRWETVVPSQSSIVLNNQKLYIIEKGKVKTYDTNSNKAYKALNDLMLCTASGNILNSKEYNTRLYENEKYVLAELTPKSSLTKKYIKTMEVLIDKQDYTVSSLTMKEPSGDYTKIDFSNKKINQPIANTKFSIN